MPTYGLTIQFDNRGLDTVNAAAQLVTIVKSVETGTPVAWVTFSPMEDNEVTWTNTYSVYASTTQIQNMAQIVTRSTQPAVGGNLYTLAGGHFDNGNPNAGVPATQYGVFNNDPPFYVGGIQMITSGLYAGAVVNGEATQSPLNAVAVPYLQHGYFTPIEKVQVFTSSIQNNGLVISQVISNALTVDLTTDPNQTIYYNAATNQFAPGQLGGS
jgi:hypothetical protein